MALNDSISLVKKQLKETWLLTTDFNLVLAELGNTLGVTFATPALVYPHERAVPPELFPAAELLGIESLPFGESLAQQYNHTIDVLWLVNGDDEPTIVQHVEALVLATRRLSFRKTLVMPDGTTAPVIPGREDYGPLTQSTRTALPLVKAARIRLVIPTYTV